MTAHNSKLPSIEFLRKQIDSGVSPSIIAERYGVTADHVRSTMRVNGFPIERPATMQDLFDKKSFAADLRAGLRLNQIDRKYGANPGAARRFAIANGLKPMLPNVQILADKIVYARTLSNSRTGGTTRVAVSVPRTSIQVAHLEAQL